MTGIFIEDHRRLSKTFYLRLKDVSIIRGAALDGAVELPDFGKKTVATGLPQSGTEDKHSDVSVTEVKTSESRDCFRRDENRLPGPTYGVVLVA